MKRAFRGLFLSMVLACAMIVLNPKPAHACINISPIYASTYAALLWSIYGEFYFNQIGIYSADQLTLMILGDICV